MITRLHAMYQRSRKMLIFLIVIFVALMIACRVNAAIGMSSLSGGKLDLRVGNFTASGWWDTLLEEFVLSGIHCCILEGDNGVLTLNTWILKTLWEVLALCLAAWIAVKHFHELRRFGSSTRLTIRDYVTVLLRTHIGYFAAWAHNFDMINSSAELLLVLDLPLFLALSLAPYLQTSWYAHLWPIVISSSDCPPIIP